VTHGRSVWIRLEHMKKIIVLRHGESVWNKENRFTGWKDVELSPLGREEAVRAGRVLKAEGLEFDQAFTSVLKRAIHTLDSVMTEIDQSWLPVEKSWRLNERHYGALTGLNKAETAEKHGEAQVKIWRRSYATPPPPLAKDSREHAANDRRYANVARELLPDSEALKNTVDRVLPYWNERIVPEIKAGKRLLIAAHGNSIRALLKHLEGMSEDAILEVNVPTAVPLEIILDGDMKFVSKRYLGDAAEIEKAMHHVANQGKAQAKS
jgi:2,3-bisphosphoglycerate-dependent phosphoglycerate mutase